VSEKSLRVVAVVAARDEEATIAMTAKSLAMLDGVSEVIVVANGCSDRTAEVAGEAGARVLVGEQGRGKGGALEAAVERTPADVYLLVDGDVGVTATETSALLEEVLAGTLDLAVGVLPPLVGGGFGLVRRFSAWCIHRLSGFQAEAPLSGQRAISKEAMDACRPLAGGFGLETAMTIDAARLGYRVGEVPVEMTHRATGRGPKGFLHRARQGWDIVVAVVPRALGLR
jgi:glycosyltransferase involved in cell wall biosynthesis